MLNIYLTSGKDEPTKQQKSKDAVEDAFGAKPGTRLVTLQAQYTMLDLGAWYSQMRDKVWEYDEVVRTDLAEQRNRIVIGVEDLSIRRDLEGTLTELGIPLGAVVIEQASRPVFDHTLEDRADDDEMMGGYQVSSSQGACTMGFVTIRSGEAGFVTNGHCTEAYWNGGVNSTRFYQPTISSTNGIGTEIIDPDFDSSLPNCPNTHVCRRSDSACIKLDSDVDHRRGYIAKPIAIGSKTVSHGNQFRITSESSVVVTGNFLNKVGRSSGWRQGRVVGTCENFPTRHSLDDDEGDPSVAHTLTCQHRVSMFSQRGDSRSPMFRITGGNDVELVGIHWGRIESDGETVFSSIGRIYLDLDSSATWDSCAPGQGC